MNAQTGTRRPRVLARAGLVILLALAAMALAGPLLAPYDPDARTGLPFAAPSSAHWLGTNDVGRDLLSVLIVGARVSLLVGLTAALAATTIGTAVGLLAGYARGWVDSALMRLVDVVLALPVLPLTIVIGVFLGPGVSTQILVIGSVIWAGTARELRSQVLSLREHPHIEAVRAMGAPPGYVLGRHVLATVGPLVVPQFVLATKTAIVLGASLAFLGLGDPTAKSWGTMLSFAQGRSAFLTDAWLWWVLPPGLMIALTVLAFALLGYAFEERARPSLRQRPARAWSRSAAAPTPAADTTEARPPLRIEGLTVTYGTEQDQTPAVSGLGLSVERGELVGLVGESGAGKSTVAALAAGLAPAGAQLTAGRVLVCGHDLARAGPEQLRALRGDRVGLIPQEAMSALNPVHTVRAQLVEAITAHRELDREAARARARELLELVGLDPDRGRDFPHQLSGGMRQRVVIAIALASDPDVLVADEPTAGLDVLAQAEVLDLLDGLRRRLGVALLLVSHDLPVVESVADRIAVMRGGELVETGPVGRIVTEPQHPYTASLVAAVPRLALEPEASRT